MNDILLLLTTLIILAIVLRIAFRRQHEDRDRIVTISVGLMFVLLLVLIFNLGRGSAGFQPGSGQVALESSTLSALGASGSVLTTTPTLRVTPTLQIHGTPTPVELPYSATVTPSPIHPSATPTSPAKAETTLAVPTATSSVAATPTAVIARTDDSYVQQLVAADGQLQRGEFQAELQFGSSSSAMSTVRFDLEGIPRLQLTSIYRGTNQQEQVDAITIGTQGWQRTSTTSWKTVPARNPLQDLQSYLPHAQSGSNYSVTHQADGVTIAWSEAARNWQVEVVVDTVTGVPRSMSRTNTATGVILTVHYTSWNMPVSLIVPADLPQ